MKIRMEKQGEAVLVLLKPRTDIKTGKGYTMKVCWGVLALVVSSVTASWAGELRGQVAAGDVARAPAATFYQDPLDPCDGGGGSDAAANIIYVSKGATGANNGSKWSDAFVDFQDGLAAATPGKVIWVATGIYFPGSARSDTFELKSHVAIYGGFIGDGTEKCRYQRPMAPTILSGEIGAPGAADNSLHVVTAADFSLIDGFAVVSGYADLAGIDSYGAGMLVEGVTYGPHARNINFENNEALSGGAIYSVDSNSLLDRVEFRNNVASDYGGGIWTENAQLMILDGYFKGNYTTSTTLGGGGGLAASDGSVVRIDTAEFDTNGGTTGNGGGLRFQDSSGTLRNLNCHSNMGALGGALFTAGSSVLSVEDSLFRNNIALAGGAIHANATYADTTYVSYSIFEKNKASGLPLLFAWPGNGGAIDFVNSNGVVANSVFVSNAALAEAGNPFGTLATGGAVRVSSLSEVGIYYSTFYQNSADDGGGAISISSNATTTIANSILWDDWAGSSAEIRNLSTGTNVRNSLIESAFLSGSWDPDLGNDWGGNLDMLPQFQDPTSPRGASGEWRDGTDGLIPTYLSPAVDAGYPYLFVPITVPKDLRGVDRVLGTAPDMGAYEHVPCGIMC